ncbi:uncharacterized protein EKO05_0000287 [Ascochyta rabiei]|uniref:uncharacterized protein n=1 Tax=Didymella rabiei TaxID=5454 RepID=UPI0022033505|nr:uncharacterized protein EKO05_0000287 [Ascochyta rabiei]UPX09600.1 hypothetical protein EKO05_0000287 [Ascochyta rabiei]
MARFTSLLLLAASSSIVAGGPLPKGHRRQLLSSYANTISVASSTVEVSRSLSTAEDVSSTSLATADGSVFSSQPTFASTRPSNSVPTLLSFSEQYASAETAVIIQPVQPTIFTQTAPAITFLLPDGQAMATQTPEVVLSTSFITSLAPVPTLETKSSVVHSDVASSSSAPAGNQPMSSVSSFPAKGLSSSKAEAESEAVSATTYAPPMFTYSPDESTTAAFFAPSTIIVSSTVISSALPSSIHSSSVTPSPAASVGGPPAQNGTGMPGFTHPGTSQGTATPGSSPISYTSAGLVSVTQVLSSAVPTSSTVSSLPSPSSVVLPPTNSTLMTSSRLVVTKTEYTTVFPTPAASQVSFVASSALSSTLASSAPAVSVISSTSAFAAVPAVPVSSSVQTSVVQSPSAELLPSTSLQVPPVVIVTQYTTVLPSPSSAPAETPPVFSTPASSSSSIVISAAPSSVSTSAESATTLSPSTGLAPSSSSSTLAASSSPIASSLPTPSGPASSGPPYSVTNVEPSPTEAPAGPSEAPSAPAPTSNSSEGPLIITPIAPSQIFTVTVTEKEKETVTATVTATITA